MAVVKSIADKVAVMERGKVVEVGDVYEVFAHPKQPITQKFVQSSSSLGNITKLIENDEVAAVDTPEKKLIKLTFTRESVDNA
ncbi:MAG TPA: methionine ABC transporter ATP-binding protein, partial [Oribacterium sp.]|nr:methionine ABC transporter ATP-binding protein [Oribacterium sp.]